MEIREVMGGGADPAVVAHSGPQRNNGAWRALAWTAALGVDVAMIGTAFLTANLFLNGGMFRSEDTTMLLALGGIFLLSFFYAGGYLSSSLVSIPKSLGRITLAWLASIALVLLVFFSIKTSSSLSRSLFLTIAIATPFFLWSGRAALLYIANDLLKIRLERRLVIEDGLPVQVPEGWDLARADRFGFRPDPENPVSLHNFSGLVAPYDRVVISCPTERRSAWALYLGSAACDGKLVMPELFDIVGWRVRPFEPWPTLQVSIGPMNLPARVGKRVLDLSITAPLIVLLSPVFFLVALAIKLDSPGPILFRQQRMGRHNRLFDVFKFRSMYVESTDRDGTRSASRDDDRITRVGRFIRATSIDELPQLLNVLQGDMSLVGPRPHALGSRAGTSLFWEIDMRYWLRHSVKPGITGLAQVRGYRGATPKHEDLTDRLSADLEYLDGWSLSRDLIIMLRTATVMVHRNAF